MAKVEFSPALMKLTQGQSSLEVTSSTLSEVIQEIESKFPGIKEKLLTESGQIQRYVSVFIGSEDARYLDGLKTKISKSDHISILLALAGG